MVRLICGLLSVSCSALFISCFSFPCVARLTYGLFPWQQLPSPCFSSFFVFPFPISICYLLMAQDHSLYCLCVATHAHAGGDKRPQGAAARDGGRRGVFNVSTLPSHQQFLVVFGLSLCIKPARLSYIFSTFLPFCFHYWHRCMHVLPF